MPMYVNRWRPIHGRIGTFTHVRQKNRAANGAYKSCCCYSYNPPTMHLRRCNFNSSSMPRGRTQWSASQTLSTRLALPRQTALFRISSRDKTEVSYQPQRRQSTTAWRMLVCSERWHSAAPNQKHTVLRLSSARLHRRDLHGTRGLYSHDQHDLLCVHGDIVRDKGVGLGLVRQRLPAQRPVCHQRRGHCVLRQHCEYRLSVKRRRRRVYNNDIHVCRRLAIFPYAIPGVKNQCM